MKNFLIIILVIFLIKANREKKDVIPVEETEERLICNIPPDVLTAQRQEVLDAIITRTSVRKYTAQPISLDTLQILVRTGMAAPTARNSQPWSFTIVTDKALLQQLGNSEALPYTQMAANAPAVIVACGDMTLTNPGTSAGYWVQDLSAATQNILLAAHSMGLGAVWTGVYPMQEKVDAVSEILNLPSHIVPLSVIPVGYPAEVPEIKEKFKEEKLHYNRW